MLQQMTDRRMMRVIGKESVADGVVALTLADTDGGQVPRWEPGAHIDLVLDDDTVRQYSLCGDESDPDTLRVAVLREQDGRGGSRQVHDRLEEGDVLPVAGPRNNFPLVDGSEYLFIAGGIGITPLVPMMARAAAGGARWSLLFGGRTRTAMAFVDELEDRYPGMVAARPQDVHGLLDLDAALDRVSPGTHVYCCGPGPLLRAVEDRCRDRDVTLHVEHFTPKQIDDARPDAAFEVVLDRSGTAVAVGADESVLDALERSGVDVEFSCREGTCGTCETAVLDGTPEHRDSVLDDDERAANDCMMVCVSRSRSPRLVLDL
ncbi:PDR/VanB family oxidoreductase [Gordonia sp. NPDC003376]